MLVRLLLAMLMPLLSGEEDSDDDIFAPVVAPAGAAAPPQPPQSVPSDVSIVAMRSDTQLPTVEAGSGAQTLAAPNTGPGSTVHPSVAGRNAEEETSATGGVGTIPPHRQLPRNALELISWLRQHERELLEWEQQVRRTESQEWQQQVRNEARAEYYRNR